MEQLPKSPNQEGIKANICGTTDGEMNCLSSKLCCVAATERDKHACARPLEWNSFDGHVQHMGTMPI